MQKAVGLSSPALGRGSSKQALVSTKRVSEGLRILQDSPDPHFTPIPPSQPPYPECELQEWKTGARGGHHWGGWGSQGKGQDPEALVTETRSEPVRLLFSTSDTHSVGPPHPCPHFGTQRSRTPASTFLWAWGKAHHAGHSFMYFLQKLFIKHPTVCQAPSSMRAVWNMPALI